MIPLKIENIREVLQAKGYEARFQPETGQINVIFKIETKEFPLFTLIVRSSGINSNFENAPTWSGLMFSV